MVESFFKHKVAQSITKKKMIFMDIEKIFKMVLNG